MFALSQIIVYVMTATPCSAFPKETRHNLVKGPWELVIQIGGQGPAFRFPVVVDDPDKETKLNAVLPVMGTPMKITLEQYLPDLTWDTVISEQSGGGAVATLTIKGPNLEQKMWLASDVPERQALTSHIGGVALKKVEQAATLKQIMEADPQQKIIGVVTARLKDPNILFESIIEPGKTYSISDTEYQIEILEYLPHYSIDTQTRQVINQSDKPVNPTIKITIDDGSKKKDHWFWSKFGSSPHAETNLPLSITFTDFDLTGTTGSYIIAYAPDSDPWLISSQDGKRQAQKVEFGRDIPFTDDQYSFRIEQIMDHARIDMVWANKSHSLLHPALIMSIEENGRKYPAVLELNKPHHQKIGEETVVILFRQKPDSSKQEK
jgi:hypothetical protein